MEFFQLHIRQTTRLQIPQGTSNFSSLLNQVDQVQWHPLEDSLFLSASCDKTVKLFDLRVDKPQGSIDTKGHNINLALHPSGTALAVGNRDDKVHFIDLRQFSQIEHTLDFKHEVNEMSWDRKGQLFMITTG
jgi:THO complex subunit 3